MTESLGKRAGRAVKWSLVTQVVSKLISPITTMILARLLTPEAYGIVAASTMVISLANMFSDAGFQKYLVQHDFENEEDKSRSASVAFWTNLTISFLLFFLIAIFNEPLATLVGCEGKGLLLIVSSISLPLTSLISVQTAMYQRDFDFKTLFFSRVGSALVIPLVAIPLALLGADYWSLAIGTIASNVFIAIWLTLQSPWKPHLYYSFKRLRAMFSFGGWILLESFATWVTTWAGTFIIGNLMNSTYVGYYRTSTSMASSITGIVTAAVLPIIFSSLSRLHDDKSRFDSAFYTMQNYLAICLIPIAVGSFVYRDALVAILLGDQWSETSLFFGLWMFAGCIVIVFHYVNAEAYRASGKPKYCVIVQVIYLAFLIPTIYISASQSYEVFSIAVPLIRLMLAVISMITVWLVLKLSPLRMLLNIKWSYLQTAVAMIPGVIVCSLTSSVLAACASIVGSVIIYVAFLMLVPSTRKAVVELLGRLGLSKVLPKRFRGQNQSYTEDEAVAFIQEESNDQE